MDGNPRIFPVFLEANVSPSAALSPAAGPRRLKAVAGAAVRALRPRPKGRRTYAIGLSRLPRVDESPGLILITLSSSGPAGGPRRIGVVTDAALRGRLAHFDAHSANEIAEIRRKLALDGGQVTVQESWPNLAGCLGFWSGFTGLQIRPIAWTCEKCGAATEEQIGGSVGESFSLLCPCGQVAKIAVPKYAPDMDPALRR